MIRIVTDSGAMLPDRICERYAITVVPMTITLDDHEFAEGSEIDNAEFYARLTAGAAVSTAAPSPGAFADAYRTAARAGATRLLSIHTGSAYSATVASATLAADLSGLDVTVVDIGVVSFAVALSAWAAAEQLVAGHTLGEAVVAAKETAARAGSLFVVGVPALARRGGRFVSVDGDLAATTVLELAHGALREHGAAPDIDAAIEMMFDHALRLAGDGPLRLGVGHAVHEHVARQLVERLTGRPGIVDVTTYEVGPSVGAHTGPGTIGIVFAPTGTPQA